jgi:hypothetical protein
MRGDFRTSAISGSADSPRPARLNQRRIK